MNPRAAVALLALVVLAPAAARAETVEFTNGRRMTGLVIEETDESVVVRTALARKSYARKLVRAIRPDDDPAAAFATVFKALGKRNVEGFWDLVLWARRKGLEDEESAALARVLEIEPGHENAHLYMGHVRRDGVWMSPADAKRHDADVAYHRELLGKYSTMFDKTPRVVLTEHWEVVDLLGDEGAEGRAADLEKAWGEAVAMLGEPAPWKGRGHVVLCAGPEEFGRWIDKEAADLPGMNNAVREWIRKSTGMKWNEPPVLARTDLPSRTAMHAANLHAAGHLLVNNWNGYNRKAPFWIEEGFGAWIESRVLQSLSSYCFELQDRDDYDLKFRASSDWDADRADLKALSKRTAAESGDRGFLPLEQLDALPRAQYGRREVGQSFALVAYLLQPDRRAGFPRYLELVKKGTGSPQALEKTWKTTFVELEKDWKRWVRDEW